MMKTERELAAKYIILIGIVLLVISTGLFIFSPELDPKDFMYYPYYEKFTLICIVSGSLALLGGILKLIFRKLR